MLTRIGVKAPPSRRCRATTSSPKYVIPGNFDITPFAYIGTCFPVASEYGIYANSPKGADVNANFGRVGSPAIDAAMDRATGE